MRVMKDNEYDGQRVPFYASFAALNSSLCLRGGLHIYIYIYIYVCRCCFHLFPEGSGCRGPRSGPSWVGIVPLVFISIFIFTSTRVPIAFAFINGIVAHTTLHSEVSLSALLCRKMASRREVTLLGLVTGDVNHLRTSRDRNCRSWWDVC